MFGRGRFNRLRYNPPDVSNDYIFREIILASVECEGYAGEDIPLSMSPLASFGGKSGISFKVAAVVRCAGAFQLSLDFGIIGYIIATLAAAFDGKTAGTMNCHVSGQLSGTFGQSARESGDLMVSEVFAASVRDRAKLGANYNLAETEVFEIVNAAAGTAQFDNKYMTISVSIPPGGVLEIDTENYTVTLNGENVLFAHSGAWAEIDRKTKEIEVILPARGNFSASLEYTERFL